MEQFALEALEERLGEGIVIARADPAHAAADAVTAADLGEGGRAVSGAPVGVENDAMDPAAAGGHSHLDRVGGQGSPHVVGDRPAHHLSRADVDHRGEVEPRRADGYVRDVAAPPGVQRVRGEVAHHRVRRGWHGPVRDRGALLLAQVPADDGVDPHQPGDALSVGPVSAGTEFGMDARSAVSAMVLGVDGPDLGHGPFLPGLALGAGLLGGQVPVVAGARCPQHPADPLDAEVGAVVGDEVPAVGSHFTSRAK
jgi:hypothetical protein